MILADRTSLFRTRVDKSEIATLVGKFTKNPSCPSSSYKEAFGTKLESAISDSEVSTIYLKV